MSTATRSPKSSVRRVAPTLLVVAVTVLVLAHLAITGDTASLWTYNLATILPGLAAGSAWYLCRRSPRSAWNWIAGGVMCSALGDVIYLATSQLTADDPQASFADLAWVCAYAMFGIGILQLLRRDPRRRMPDVDVLLDLGTVIAIALPVIWEVSPNDVLSDSSTAGWIRGALALHPVLDAVLLALATRLVLTREVRTPAVAMLLLGIGSWLAADFGLILVGGGSNFWLDLGWMAGAGLTGAAAVHGIAEPRCNAHTTGDAPVLRSMSTWRMAFSVLAMLVPVSLGLAAQLRGDEMNPFTLLATTAALGALLFIRAFRLLHEMRDAERQLRSTGSYYRAIAANSSDAVMVVARNGAVINDSSNLGELVGSPIESAVGASILDLIWLAEPDEVRAVWAASVATPGQMHELEVRLFDRDGGERWLAARVVNLLDDPAVGGVVINLHDITARKRAEESLEHQAFHDGLTGLANRALFHDRVEHALELAARTDRPPAVLYLDLDGFKRVNDTLGHEVGDHLLRQVASRLELVVRDSDTVSRLGGDEFAILVEHGGSMDGGPHGGTATTTAERVLDALRVPIQLGSQSISVSASIGIAAGGAGSDATTLLRDADTAMYHAKTNGRGRFEWYSTEMRETALERLRIESDLPSALEHGQFRLVYQPIVRLDSLQVSGFEALLRWDHPLHGPVPPDRFIPICEENGLIHPIGEWVLRTACATAANWEASGHNASISVNLSGRQLSSDALVGLVSDVLARTGLRPGSLVLEVTETSLVDDADAAAERLHALASLGVQLAIDDFGTGYSSLAYLRMFPVDILKIDGSFVQSINDPVSIPPIIPGLLGLGRTLGLQVVAEGIENDVQRTWLQAEGCAYGQGYLFAAPMSADEALATLQGGAIDAVV